ncbi:MAG TPA: SEC-C metal-binding domain-containing protein, partial [Azonexus sp.]|nr:SEC-C metal-binding domain-containing protein [Azonexus sp.]
GLQKELAADLLIAPPVADWVKAEPTLSDEEILARILEGAAQAYQAKVELVGTETFRQFERNVMLQSLDSYWREHLAALDHLRQGIHLRGYAQKNPKQEYKREAFELFETLLDQVRTQVTRVVFTVQIRSPEDVEETAPHADVSNVKYQHAGYDEALADEGGDANQPVENGPKVGRNDPCPCGSGKKYKHCHGKLS